MNISLNKANQFFLLNNNNEYNFICIMVVTGQCIYERIINSDYVYTRKYVVKCIWMLFIAA